MAKYRNDEFSQEIAEYVFLMAYIAERREWDNRSHLRRMKAYVFTLCTDLGIPIEETELIALASQLHDVGKSCTPLELLLRKGEYSSDEWFKMEQHTLDGEIILHNASNAVLQTAAIIALTHHERWDGTGYPHKLGGEEIPLSGRICAIADVYDALITPRPYKVIMPEDEVLELIRNSAGFLFDPNIVNTFISNYPDIKSIKENSSL